MPSDTDFSPRLRLHRHSWLFVAADYLRHLLVPLLAALFLGARDNHALWGLAALGPVVAGALWQQWIYRYGFGPRGLVIREGLIFRNVRSIDYARIENIDTERNLLHRALGVALVRVETSSGGGSEAVIRVLDLDAVETMRQQVFAARLRATPAAPDRAHAVEEELLHLDARELLRYGLIDNRGLIVVAAVFGFFVQSYSQRAAQAQLETLVQRLPFAELATLGPGLQLLFAVTGLVGLVAGTRLLSVLMAFVTLHDFRLVRAGDDLHVRHGLLTRVSLTLRRPRVQAVHWKETLLHRLFHRVSVRADLAGGLGGANGEQAGQRAARTLWLAPVCSRDIARRLTEAALPMVDCKAIDWQRLPLRARMRLFRLLALLWLGLAALPLALWMGAWAAIPLVSALPLLWLHAHLYVKHTGWALYDTFFILRRGWLTRRLSVAPRDRVQSVHLAESPFDRRHRMTSLHLDTAGAGTRALHVPYLDREIARQLATELAASAGVMR